MLREKSYMGAWYNFEYILDEIQYKIEALQPRATHLTNKLRDILGTAMHRKLFIYHKISNGVARGVMVIVVGNGHGDSSSNPGRDCLQFT